MLLCLNSALLCFGFWLAPVPHSLLADFQAARRHLLVALLTLLTAIAACLQVRLRKEIADAKRVLANLPKAIETPEEQRLLLSTGVQKVVSAFTAAAEGRGEDKHKSLHVCARADELYDGYCRALREATPNFLGEEMFETVQQALAETRGAALSNFLNSNVFKGVVMDTYREPLQDAGGELVSSLRAYVQASC